MAPEAPPEAVVRLIEVSRSITAVLDQDELLQKILASAVLFTGAERGSLILADPDSPEESYRVKAVHRMDATELDEEEFTPSKKSILHALRTRQRVDRQNALDEADPSRSVELYGLRSILIEPMIVQERMIGLIYLDSRITSRFSAGSKEILPSFVAQAAICVENSRLIHEREEALKEQHREQVHSREMEAWSAAMSAFVSIASHDLKGPLTVLKNGIFLLRRLNPSPDAVHVLDDMEGSLKRAIRLVETYLDATALFEERALEVSSTPVELKSAIEQEVEFSRSKLAENRRALYPITVEVPGDLRVHGDPNRLEQVLGNLLDNAIKYSPGGTPITVRAQAEGDQVLVEVIDSGPGIAPERQPRLFERFVRGETGNARGTGLGLWIVRSLLASMGGSIELESQPGKGSTFRIRLKKA
jgi:signal transduction histidine kinase